MTFEYIRNEQGLFVCPHCKVTKTRQNTMHYHLKKHEGKLPFQCSTCKKEFQFQQTLDLHRLAKHCDVTDKKFKCPFANCEFQSLTEGNRRIHFLRKHCAEDIQRIQDANNQFQCTACKKSFKSSTAFHYHASSCVNIHDKTRRDMLEKMLSAT
jgi:KRAB domain-containing zinc finger protein